MYILNINQESLGAMQSYKMHYTDKTVHLVNGEELHSWLLQNAQIPLLILCCTTYKYMEYTKEWKINEGSLS
jgi:hypothetical protein